MVDNFLVKSTAKDNVEFLLDCLSTKYKHSVDWTCKRYVGLYMKWDYDNRTCNISMPGYIERALQRFAHKRNWREDSPHEWTKPNYGAKVQYASDNESPLLDASNKKRVQEVVGSLLF